MSEDLPPSRADWAGPHGRIGAYIREETKKTLEAYRNQPNLVAEHANHEEDTARGGYAHRQLFELVQNSADALSESSGGRIDIKLTPTHLYCADDGQPIDLDGVKALMFSYLSPKRGTTEIGRFGLGFKSVLGVTDTPEFFSRSGSFRFDRAKSAKGIQAIAPNNERYPVLRLPEAIDPWQEIESDLILRDLAGWAVNIVRLSLKPEASESLGSQIKDFPPEFLLFVEHVAKLELQNDDQEARVFSLGLEDDRRILDDGRNRARWMVVNSIHKLSPDARGDRRSLDDAGEVPISWAVPIDRLNDPGRFWAFFPTMTTSLLAGILNAPWKTNEDRQNLLPGIYNDELIDAAVDLVADALPRLSTTDAPARHLDALPRRYEAGDSAHSDRLRDQLYSNLRGREIFPDQEGKLRKPQEISYPPKELTDAAQGAATAFKRWAAYDGRPLDWLHHSALTRTRLATIDRLFPHFARKSISSWLEALVEDAESQHRVQASMAAIQTAALIPGEHYLGKIVLAANGRWVAPDPESVTLSGDVEVFSKNGLVHHQLEADAETWRALHALGIKPSSQESQFRKAVPAMHGFRDEHWREFWQLSRKVDQQAACEIIQKSADWRDTLRVRTVAGGWSTLFDALLPGPIVPADGSRDGAIAIDVEFHEHDLTLLQQLGAIDAPRDGHGLLRKYSTFLSACRAKYYGQDLPSQPQWDKLKFIKATTSGPLDVLEALSEEGKALYTWQLLSLNGTYEPWVMRHQTRDIYPPMEFDSPALDALRLYGRLRTDEGIGILSEGFEDPPASLAVLRKLLSHPKSDSIRRAFGLSVDPDTLVEPIGEDDPIPLLDEWPGLKDHLAGQQVNLELVRCDGFRELGNASVEAARDCLISNDSIYVRRQDDEHGELRAVLQGLGLQLNADQIKLILLGLTDAGVRASREAVADCSTDEERLLEAVGEGELRRRLPGHLVTILEQTHGPLEGIQIAQAAIATFHTSALREYRHALTHLDPPKRWAGSPRAVSFVRSLGFEEEWAGERNTRRDPYVEVEGPYSLPELHDYQSKVVGNVRRLIQPDGMADERRGMISMPTGSGKTRVAVQAIVEAIREDGFRGGILWVADRDELCEQAVEQWRQVWSSEGAQATKLRISRMWAGQPRPFPTSEMHVIVATIQTLAAKIDRQSRSYEFLADFKLLVFDEAHRSVAPTFTSVMQDLGLTRWRRGQEPFLIGLTATPYRGHDAAETARLVNRYGSNRLDSGAFGSNDPEEVIRELQAMRILAQADHDTVEGGRFYLSDDEVRQSRQTPWLPQSVERRIAHDLDRTERIVAAYKQHIKPDWPTLIFATSVEHSQTVAALLTSMGVRARAVSATTDASSRRRIVDEFRSGQIKALVNYGIFREGFDAPKTRAIIVARPVYSPNLYFQMVGRGLRGVKNGGNDRCLILNVKDNIENFERKLAFSDLDWLWS